MRLPECNMASTAKTAAERQASADTTLYISTEAELLGKLGTAIGGLTSEQAADKLHEVGPNTVAAGGRRSALVDLLNRCPNPPPCSVLGWRPAAAARLWSTCSTAAAIRSSSSFLSSRSCST